MRRLPLAAVLVLAGLAPAQDLRAALDAALERPEVRNGHWGVLVQDLDAGTVLYERNADRLFAPASNTKLFSVAAFLVAFGADHRFVTGVVRRGEVDGAGTLRGDLILVAGGDPTLGGRTDEGGRVAFTDGDHTYANGNDRARLTPQDPLAGLDALARAVAARGVREVAGDVLVDARLFPPTESTGSGLRQVSAVMVNDNLIDFSIHAAEAGAPARVEWRPACALVRVDAAVQTAAAGTKAAVRVESPAPWRFVVRGTVPADRTAPLVRVAEVPDAASFARSLFRDALVRAGVRVTASPLADHPTARLPASRSESLSLPEVAAFASPPFAEHARLILKVSHNLHASALPLLLSAREGSTPGLAGGLRAMGAALQELGLDPQHVCFGGGAGGSRADFATPRATVALLAAMARRADADAFRAALPILGVDGTLARAVAATSPARGKAQAKTGTYFVDNALTGGALLTSKALSGYLEGKSGRRLAFALYVNVLQLKSSDDADRIGAILGQLCELVHAHT